MQTDALLPLSQSPLWRLQREYFERAGVDAWRKGVVPSFVTSNAFIAHAYAQVVAAHLEDVSAAERAYVVELGAGSGRFAHHFLRAYFDDDGERARPPITYVMSDISRANVEFWRAHPKLAEYVARGVLDFALFDACADRALTMLEGGRTLGDAAPGRVIAIANYLFDSIPHDLFMIDGGRLYECHVALDAQRSLDMDPSYEARPCSEPRYADASWNRLLDAYGASLSSGWFLLPVGALQCVANLIAMARGRLLLLSADKGTPALTDVRRDVRPLPARHGSISFNVNYHALTDYVTGAGGQVIEPKHTRRGLHVAAYVFGAARGELSRTRDAFEQHIADFGPADLVELMRTVTRHRDTMGLLEIAELLDLARCDADVFRACQPRLAKLLPGASPEERRSFRAILHRVLAADLSGTSPHEISLPVGALFSALGDHEQALALFERAESLTGPTAVTRLHAAVTSASLGRLEEARRHARDALRLDPQLAAARVLSVDLDLTLAPLTPAHAPWIAAHADAEVTRLSRLAPISSELDAARWIRAVTTGAGRRAFAIEHVDRGTVGVITLSTFQSAGSFVFWLSREHWGLGLGTAAAHRLRRLAITQDGVEELFTLVLAENVRSIRALERLGFRRLADAPPPLFLYRWGARPSDPHALARLRRLLDATTSEIEEPAWPT